jgi:hypothetical protein
MHASYVYECAVEGFVCNCFECYPNAHDPPSTYSGYTSAFGVLIKVNETTKARNLNQMLYYKTLNLTPSNQIQKLTASADNS